MANNALNRHTKIQKQQFANERQEIARLRELGAYPASFSMPLGIQFELTAKCNLKCKHCYNQSHPQNDDAMMLFDWQRTVSDIIAAGGIFQCIVSGGEPLMLGDNLFDIMTPLHNDGTSFILITNGWLVHEDIVNRLKRYRYYWTQVSIDHLHESEHDVFRGCTGSWQRAVNAAELFSAAGLPLRIAHSVTPDNLQYLEQFIDFAYLLGASSIVCGDVMLSGRVAENRNLLMNDEQRSRMYEIIDSSHTKYAGRLTVIASMSEQLSIESKNGLPNTSVIIRPNGDVRLDCTMPFVIGNVLQKPFPEIWKEYGNTCWQDERVKSYIANHCGNTQQINHYTPDTLLYPQP
ncbi:MAG: radical SAM protein [Planctomycetaceae bacterium]|jgi:MoaA/NifB/PqqE/SkfB family radical SAM enzyme|nr:radical SAM protein [Planctomycetaceae bacterium]